MRFRMASLKLMMPSGHRLLVQTHFFKHSDPLLFVNFILHRSCFVVHLGRSQGAATLHYEAIDGSTVVLRRAVRSGLGGPAPLLSYLSGTAAGDRLPRDVRQSGGMARHGLNGSDASHDLTKFLYSIYTHSILILYYVCKSRVGLGFVNILQISSTVRPPNVNCLNRASIKPPA